MIFHDLPLTNLRNRGMFPGYVGLPAAALNDAFNLVAQRSDLGDDDSDGDYMGSI